MEKTTKETTLLMNISKVEKRLIEVLARAEGKTTSEYLRSKALNR
jgi:hypothetical protein